MKFVQSTLGFKTRGLAPNLALASSSPMTDLRLYINCNLATLNCDSNVLVIYTGRYIQRTLVHVGFRI